MYDEKVAQATRPTPASRIDVQTEQIKGMSTRVARIRSIIVAHARSLGFFELPSTSPRDAVGPTPVINNLSEALAELEREIEHLDGTLNLFN